MMKGKKGDVPITILVLGVFVVCSLALLSFYLSNLKMGEAFQGIDSVEKMNLKINEYNFYKNYGKKSFSDEEVKTILEEEDFYFNVEQSFFEINQTDESLWFWRDDEFLFSIKYLLP